METAHRFRVLCVDDDANVLAALNRQLRHRYDVVLARGGTEALARLHDEGPFDVVVSDLHMPGMDGCEFLLAALTVAPDLPALLMTGSGDAAAPVPEPLRPHAVRKLAKPCRPDVLWAALDAAIAPGAAGCADVA